MRFTGGITVLPSEQGVSLAICPEVVCFDGKPTPIDDSSNMSRKFETKGGRILTLRWIGTNKENSLPIWEFTSIKEDCNFVICSTQFTGYGEFVYVKGRLTQTEHSAQTKVA